MSGRGRRGAERRPALRLPLPAALQELLGDGQVSPSDGDNLGLWLDKFVRRDQSNKWKIEADDRVRELERLFCPYDLGSPRPWYSAAATEALGRLQASCEVIYGEERHRSLVVRVHGRLLVDYGRASAVETSLSLHPVLGCPRIPGSAFKGVLRAALREELPQTQLRELLGAPDAGVDDDADHQRGRLVLHDALPEGGKFQLALDVLTPHARDYYEGKGAKEGRPVPPADWISPIPHTFLTVVETSFRVFFGLLPRHEGNNGDDQEVLAMVERVLLLALEIESIGAKRSAGYGRLKRVGDGGQG